MNSDYTLDQQIGALVADVDPAIRLELASILATLRQVRYAPGVVTSLSRLCLRLLHQLAVSRGLQSPSDSLFSCITTANESRLAGTDIKVLPDEIASCLHTIRVLSNKADHAAEAVTLSYADGENSLRLFLRTLSWFYCECPLGPRLASLTLLPDLNPDESNRHAVKPSGAAMLQSGPRKRRKAALPLHTSSFIGRAQELETTKELLEDSRILTLTGSGGCGKTRLALEVGYQLQESFPDGAVFVELASLENAAMVPRAVALSAGYEVLESDDPTSLLVEGLTDAHLLVILDNCEHVIGAVASLVDSLLRFTRCPRFLVTSREPLEVEGEVTFRVPSFPIPNTGGKPMLDSLVQYDAVKLFIERAHAAHPSFRISEQNAPSVAEICARLDGIPLAIELAAARIRSMTAEQLLTRLNDRFALLTGGSRSSLPRHQTLRAAIDWSHELLNAKEQSLFRRCSVFRSGFTLEAAESVCGDDDLSAADVLDALDNLVDKSLLVYELTAGDGWYKSLETIQAFAAGELSESPEQDAMHRNHAEWIRDFVKVNAKRLHGEEQKVALNALDAEVENLRSALRWCLETGETELGLSIAGPLWRFWYFRGLSGEGRTYLTRLLSIDDPVKPAIRGNAMRGAGLLAHGHGDLAEARRLVTEAVNLFREHADNLNLASGLGALGLIVYEEESLDEAKALYDESLECYRQSGNDWGQSIILKNLGDVALLKGDLDQADSHYQDSLSLCARNRDERGMAQAEHSLGKLHQRRGSYQTSRELLAKSLRRWLDLGNDEETALVLLSLSETLAESASMPEAARLLGAVLRIRDDVLVHLPRRGEHKLERLHAKALESLGERQFLDLIQEGRSCPLESVAELCCT